MQENGLPQIGALFDGNFDNTVVQHLHGLHVQIGRPTVVLARGDRGHRMKLVVVVDMRISGHGVVANDDKVVFMKIYASNRLWRFSGKD